MVAAMRMAVATVSACVARPAVPPAGQERDLDAGGLGAGELADLPHARHGQDEGNGPRATLSLTHNAFWLESNPDGKSLRGYLMAETDNQAELLIYDVTPWVNRR